ncbi:MAG: hypothetical protein ACTS5V_08930 [Giesbergeria sp.]
MSIAPKVWCTFVTALAEQVIAVKHLSVELLRVFCRQAGPTQPHKAANGNAPYALTGPIFWALFGEPFCAICLAFLQGESRRSSP